MNSYDYLTTAQPTLNIQPIQFMNVMIFACIIVFPQSVGMVWGRGYALEIFIVYYPP